MLRFYFMAEDVPYEQTLVTLADWSSGGKAAAIASKENVSGHLPVVQLGDRSLTECHAIMRLVARCAVRPPSHGKGW